MASAKIVERGRSRRQPRCATRTTIFGNIQVTAVAGLSAAFSPRIPIPSASGASRIKPEADATPAIGKKPRCDSGDRSRSQTRLPRDLPAPLQRGWRIPQVNVVALR
jgi:hypothetical protein